MCWVDFRWVPLIRRLVQWLISRWFVHGWTLLRLLVTEPCRADGLVGMLSCHHWIAADCCRIVQTCQRDPCHGVMIPAYHFARIVVLVRVLCRLDHTGLEKQSRTLRIHTTLGVVWQSVLFCLPRSGYSGSQNDQICWTPSLREGLFGLAESGGGKANNALRLYCCS